MSIPAFDGNGLLPIGESPGGIQTLTDEEGEEYSVATYAGHVATPTQVASRFLAAYDNSSTRAILHNEWVNLREAAVKRLPNSLFMMSGSFVTDETDPVDMYLAMTADRDEFGDLSTDDQFLLRRMFDGETQSLGGDVLTVDTDLFLTAQYPHPRFDESNAALVQARYMCQHPAGDDVAVGYLIIAEDEGGGE